MGRIPEAMRRNPEAPHVKKYIEYRKRNEKPKTILKPTRNSELTKERFAELLRDYNNSANDDLAPTQEKADMQMLQIGYLMLRENDAKEREQLEKALKIIRPANSATVTHPIGSYTIAKEIINDFGKTKNLKVLGFGVGYGSLLFALKKFMGAKVKGIDLGKYSKELTSKKKLGVIHGKDFTDKDLVKLGKHDVTYSMNVLDPFLLKRNEALGLLDNAALLTRKGGHSYHYLPAWGPNQISTKDAEARGFKVEHWGKTDDGYLIKLKKIRDE